jgi:predicted ATPase/class 3 adenylate cyclase
MTLPEGDASHLTLRLFGPFDVRVNGDPLPRLRSRKGQSLLALLTLRHDREVERAWLAGMLWPDRPTSLALATLRRDLTDLRRALGTEAGRLRSPTPHNLCLDLTGAEADVVAFDAAIARGDVTSLEQAVALYRGPLLEGCEEEWSFQERQTREESYLTALETLAADAGARGDGAAAERRLRQAVAVDPLREKAQRALMQTLADGGNYAAATEAYRELRLLLHRELNGVPDAETEALFQELRAEARRQAQAPRRSPMPSASNGVRPKAAESGRLLPQGTVTFLFTDIENSTRLWEEDQEGMRAALAAHDTLLRETIRARGGRIFKTWGDQFCAAFATAPDALAGALAAQRALLTEPWPLPAEPLRVRMAVHTGTAEERDGDYFGLPVNRVARLLAAGHGGQILLSLATAELVRDLLPQGAELLDLGQRRLPDLIRPEQIFQLAAPDLPADFPPLRTLDVRPNNLPVQPTPLLGREKEVTATREMLGREEGRLVTLTGPGGTGKTRLGLQVAAELLDLFADGVFFINLAPIRDPSLIASAIAPPLGLQDAGDRPLAERLQEHLRHKQLLLLLDNFEHLLPAAPLVAELLAGCPRLKVLVTSRAALHLRGEKEFPVPPLSLPDPAHLPPVAALSQYAAVELFIQRAADVKPDFAVTNENAPAVVEICHRLDGLPLAIELAAARIKLLSPQALLAQLERCLPMLTGGARDLPARQQTLRSAIGWSYDLLEEPEQKLFRRLSAFVGGFSLEAAEAVCHGEPDQKLELLDGIASLVDKSLLLQVAGPDPDSASEARFTMLETIREFGQECLTQSEEAEPIRRQHARFFLALAEAERDRPERLMGDWDNLRAALGWALERGEADLGFRFGEALVWFWYPYQRFSEGREYMARLLALLETPSLMDARARTLDSAGTLASDQGDYGTARAYYEESLAICQALGQRDRVASRHFQLGWVALEQGDYPRAGAHYEQSRVMSLELARQEHVAAALSGLGRIARETGDLARAAALFHESLTVFRELEIKGSIAEALINLADVAHARGDAKTSRALLEESLALDPEDELFFWGISPLYMLQGHLFLELGDYGAARSRYEKGLTRMHTASDPWMTAWMHVKLGHAAWLQGEDAVTRSHAAEALWLFQQFENKAGTLAALESLAGAALLQGRKERAARLAGAVAAQREALGPLRPDWWLRPREWLRSRERIEEAVRAASLEREFAAAWVAGRGLSLDEAVAFALEGCDASSGDGE